MNYSLHAMLDGDNHWQIYPRNAALIKRISQSVDHFAKTETDFANYTGDIHHPVARVRVYAILFFTEQVLAITQQNCCCFDWRRAKMKWYRQKIYRSIRNGQRVRPFPDYTMLVNSARMDVLESCANIQSNGRNVLTYI